MRSFLVRHAKAGSRSNWTGDDRIRPLSKNGWRQAELLAERLGTEHPSALWTSPYLRCRQTLEPLARATDLDIVEDERLAEAGRFEEVLELLTSLPDGAVLCSHGDLIPDTIAALERRGCAIETPPDWRKATVWTVEHIDGEWIRATVEPPPV
jgi:phosphohistidine phosphatase SixA